MNIAFFDSGIGGMSVLKEAFNLLPGEDYIYLADTLNVPYGTKPKEEVKKVVFQAVEFLSRQDIKMLVIACNTATSIAVRELRGKFHFPIIGMEPAVKPAIESCYDKRVLVLATSLTLKEEKLNNLITRLDNKNRIDKISLDKLVLFAEKYQFGNQEVEGYLKETLGALNKNDYGCIVLGCTHFIYFKEMIQKIFSEKTQIIDGNRGTVKNIKSSLESLGLLSSNKNGSVRFYTTFEGNAGADILEKFWCILNGK